MQGFGTTSINRHRHMQVYLCTKRKKKILLWLQKEKKKYSMFLKSRSKLRKGADFASHKCQQLVSLQGGIMTPPAWEKSVFNFYTLPLFLLVVCNSITWVGCIPVALHSRKKIRGERKRLARNLRKRCRYAAPLRQIEHHD